MCRGAILFLAQLFLAPAIAAAAVTITVGFHVRQPFQANQVVDIMVSCRSALQNQPVIGASKPASGFL